MGFLSALYFAVFKPDGPETTRFRLDAATVLWPFLSMDARLTRLVFRNIVLSMAGLGVLGVVAALVYFVAYEPDRGLYPARGIDVSHHQGDIHWPSVAMDDVAFVYMKATEGGDFVDKRFIDNWAASKRAGLPRGAYHFFTFCRPAAIQAANYIATVPKEGNALPPALDLEYLGNCRARPDVEEMRNEILTWLTIVESHYGQEAVLYVTREFYRAYLEPSGIKRRLWLRSLARPPRYGSQWTIWQYHNRGTVDGISGPVDLNVADLAGLAAGSRATTHPTPHARNRRQSN